MSLFKKTRASIPGAQSAASLRMSGFLSQMLWICASVACFVWILFASAPEACAVSDSDDFSAGISTTNWEVMQANNGTMMVLGANGHASFLVNGNSTAEQNACIVWNGRARANAEWSAEVRGHNSAAYSSNGSSALQLAVVDSRFLTGGALYGFDVEFSHGDYSGSAHAGFQYWKFSGSVADVNIPAAQGTNDFKLRVIYRAATQVFESWYDDSGSGANWKLIRTSPLTEVVPDATATSEFVVALIADTYYGPISEGQLWADDFRLVNTAVDVPVISTQPASSSVTAGSLVSFGVTATGTAPLSYQWSKNGVDLFGATSATYTIASAQTTDAGSYRVVVSNSAGSTTSNSANLTVNRATPAIYAWPTASSISVGQTLASSVLSGGSASVLGAFSFTASSTAPSVGTASQSVTFTPTDSTRDNTVTGNVSVTVSAASTLPSITSSPVSLTVTGGSLASFGVAATGTAPLSYQWSKNGVALSGATSSTYTIASAQTTDAGSYRVVVSNSAGSTTSKSANLTVNRATPAIYAWPTASSISVGQTLASSVLSGGSASVLGAFAFTASSTAPSVGTASQSVTFTPTELTKYNTVSGSASVAVKAALVDAGLGVDATIGSPTVVQISRDQVADPKFFPDGHLPVVPNGSGLLYFSAGVPSHRLEADASGSIIASKSVLGRGGPTAFDNGGAWLYSVIRYPFSSPTSLVGFYHAEYHWLDLSDDFIAWKSIALATSSDNGNSWVKGAEIIRSPERRPSTPKWGGDGDHCVVWDPAKSRWICFFTNSTDGYIKMAATRDADYSPGKWFKYYNGGFTEPGLDGKEDPIPGLMAVRGGNPSVHFNTELNRWIMVYHSWEEGVPNSPTNSKSGIWISWSWDLEHWEAPMHLLAPTTDRYSDGLTYAKIWNPTIVGVSDLQAGKTAKLFYSGFQLTTDGVDASGQSFDSSSTRYGERYYRVLVQRDITFNGMKEMPPSLDFELLLLNGTMGVSFATHLNASINPTSIVCTSLPPGLVCSVSGTISGSPTRGGVIVGSAVARNGAGSSSASQLVFFVDAVATASASGSATVTFDLPSASAIGVKSITASPSSGSTFQVGTTPVNVAVETDEGITNKSFNVVVKPFGTPVITGVVNWTDLAGTYEGLLEDANDAGSSDGAIYRGAFLITFGRNGVVSGRVFYNEAPELPGGLSRYYRPVIRTFAGALNAASGRTTAFEKIVKLGTATSRGSEELRLDVSFVTSPPTVNLTVKDFVSPATGESEWVSKSMGCVRSLARLPATSSVGSSGVDYSKVVGRYTMSATDLDPTGGQANDAYVLVQALSTGKMLWTSRMKGTFGSGSAGLRLTEEGLGAAFYEGRMSSTSSLFKSTSLLGGLSFTFNSATSAWSGAFGSDSLRDRLEKQASCVSKSGGNLAYDETDGKNWTGVTPLNFSNLDGMRWSNGTSSSVPAVLAAPLTFTLSAQDPLLDLGGNTVSYAWGISIAANGKVSATSLTDDSGILSPRLLLTVDRARGELSGYYISSITGKSVRRNIYGCAMTSLTDDSLRARGWAEAGVLPWVSTGGWTLKLNP